MAKIQGKLTASAASTQTSDVCKANEDSCETFMDTIIRRLTYSVNALHCHHSNINNHLYRMGFSESGPICGETEGSECIDTRTHRQRLFDLCDSFASLDEDTYRLSNQLNEIG